MGCLVDQEVSVNLQATQVVPIVRGLILRSAPLELADNLIVDHLLSGPLQKAEASSITKTKNSVGEETWVKKSA